MHILGIIITGFLAGVVAKLITPGNYEPQGFILTTALGIVGAFVAAYWNASCLKEISSPKFWPKETLEPILAQYKKDHPAPPPRPTPICK